VDRVRLPRLVAEDPAQAGSRAPLIAAFNASGEFTGITSEKTKTDYLRYLKMIEDEFGTMPVAAVEDKRARGTFKEWRDTMADRPRTADYAWTVLARVLSVAKDRGAIAVNVCERGGRLYETDRTEIIWTANHIKKFCAVASEELHFALLLALWTGQRQGDLIRLTWAQYDGSKLRLSQRKGRKRVVIPVGAPLKAMLDSRRPKKPEGAILRNTFGEPWTSDGFRTSWNKTFKRARLGDDDLHFHDLRGTAVTRLALSGCTTPEIAAITGQSPRDVEAILDAHYLGGRVELAEQAIMKLAARYGNGT
jgi:integrase